MRLCASDLKFWDYFCQKEENNSDICLIIQTCGLLVQAVHPQSLKKAQRETRASRNKLYSSRSWREALNFVALMSRTPTNSLLCTLFLRQQLFSPCFGAQNKSTLHRVIPLLFYKSSYILCVSIPGCTPQKCGRAVTDSVVTREEAQVLRR